MSTHHAIVICPWTEKNSMRTTDFDQLIKSLSNVIAGREKENSFKEDILYYIYYITTSQKNGLKRDFSI